MSQKRIPDIFRCNSSKNCLIFKIIFGKFISKRICNQTIVYFSTSPKQCLCTTLWNRKTKIASFHSNAVATSWNFSQSLLNFFNSDLQLELVLLCEPLNLIISGLHCWADKLKAVVKRSEDDRSLSWSLTRCMHGVPVCCPAENKNFSSATCFIAVNICWDYPTNIVRWLSQKKSHNWHCSQYHGRHGERRLCAYQIVGYFIPCVGHV